MSIWGRNADKNAQAAASISAKGGKVETRVCDVTDVASVKTAMAAINALVRALAVELARYGVTANAILPGWRADGQRQVRRQRDAADPMRRFGEPSDFGGIAVYLMSKASSYHTADTTVIDGGHVAF